MKAKAKSHQDDWEHNEEKYPTRRGLCEFCGQKDDVKLSFDQIRFICVNAKVCFNRWIRNRHRDESN